MHSFNILTILTINDIIDLLKNKLHIELKSTGNNIFFLCPFHNDHKPSFCFNPQRKLFHCFSCHNFNQGKPSNVFVFFAQYKNISTEKAIEEISKYGYFSIKELNLNNYNYLEKKNKEFEKFKKIYQIINDIFNFNLFSYEALPAVKYLENRGIDRECIIKFSLGFTLSNNQIYNLLLNNNEHFSFLAQTITSLWKINSANKIYDFFPKGWLIFPLKNSEGANVAWAARSLEQPFNLINNCKYENRYLYLPNYVNDYVEYQKSNILYNYFEVSQKKENECFLVEGFFDVISLSRLKINNCIALLGTNISVHQLNLLQKLNRRIVIFFDGDIAGQEATKKIIIELVYKQIDCEVISPTYTDDPDEICRSKTPEEVNRIVNTRLNPYIFVIEQFYKKMDIKNNPQRIKTFIRDIGDIFNKLDNARDFIIKQLALMISLPIDVVTSIFLSLNNVPAFPHEELLNRYCENKIKIIEKELLQLCFNHRKYWLVLNNLSFFFTNKENQEQYWEIYNFYSSSNQNISYEYKYNIFSNNIPIVNNEKLKHISCILRKIQSIQAFRNHEN